MKSKGRLYGLVIVAGDWVDEALCLGISWFEVGGLQLCYLVNRIMPVTVNWLIDA